MKFLLAKSCLLATLACCCVGNSQSSLVNRLNHALQPGDQFVTDINTWTVDDEDFRCIHTNGSFVILDVNELCDGITSCKDGADESDPICHALERCSPGKIRCPLDRICISQSQLCDGVSDCTRDAWDERETAGCPVAKDFNAKLLECPDGFFQCKATGKCLAKEVLCNFNWDCEDGSDESSVTCPIGRACPSEMFHCYKTGETDKYLFNHCLPSDEVCNQIGDCPNSEDEMADLSPCTVESLLAITRPGRHSGTHHQHVPIELGNTADSQQTTLVSKIVERREELTTPSSEIERQNPVLTTSSSPAVEKGLLFLAPIVESLWLFLWFL